jgi:flavin-dependent dehydrogenase
MFNYKILETVITDGILRRVKYHCTLTEGEHRVETEGNWTFRAKFTVDANTSESQVAHWLDLDAIQDDKHLIKYRLQEQLDALKSAPSTKPPWAVDTFKVTI